MDRAAAGDDPVATIEAAMVALRRAQTRRTLARLARRRGHRNGPTDGLPSAVFELVDAVDAAAGRGNGLTVTEAAAALGVDQPRASRLAAQALDAGLLRRHADQSDGRRSPLGLTPQGRIALDAIHAFRRGVIGEATAGWTDRDRADLARLLRRFVADLDTVAGRSDPT